MEGRKDRRLMTRIRYSDTDRHRHTESQIDTQTHQGTQTITTDTNERRGTTMSRHLPSPKNSYRHTAKLQKSEFTSTKAINVFPSKFVCLVLSKRSERKTLQSAPVRN